MSQLQQLRSTIEEMARSSQKLGATLAGFSTQFSRQRGTIHSIIGGSSQRKDVEVMAAVDEAEAQVRKATEALEHAARVATAYGRSL